jgi:hypothetical protein
MFDGRQELGAALSSQKRSGRPGAPTSVTDFPTRGESPGGLLTLIPQHEASKPQKIIQRGDVAAADGKNRAGAYMSNLSCHRGKTASSVSENSQKKPMNFLPFSAPNA